MGATSATTALKIRAEVEFLKKKANLAEVLELKRARLRHINGLLRQQRYEKLMSRRPADWPERVSLDDVGDEAEVRGLLFVVSRIIDRMSSPDACLAQRAR